MKRTFAVSPFVPARRGAPGTYRGVLEGIPYLKELGVTAVEPMPAHEFNGYQLTGINLQTFQPLGNHWGYDPAAFFAPKAFYSSLGDRGQQKREFKEMVWPSTAPASK